MKIDRYVVRQPIKELETGKVIGYEVMFQNDGDGLFNQSDMVAADTISNFLLQNNDKLMNDKLTFLTCTPTLLFRNAPKILGNDKVIIQIDDSIIINPLSNAFIQKYLKEGYRFAIVDFQFMPKYFSSLEYTDYVKISISTSSGLKPKSELENIVNMIKGLGKKCIATGLNSEDGYKLAREIGADFLQGSYIAESMITKTNKLEFLQGNFFQLVIEISKDEPDVEEVESIISRDATLTYGILKLVNSAYYALRKRTSSVRQAIMTLGIEQLRQWVYLLSFHDNALDPAMEEILKLSFTRAMLAAELSKKIPEWPLGRNDAYMMGMFSTLEYMIDAPIEEILADIPLEEEIKVALTKKEGVCGTLYKLLLAYEKAEWKDSKRYAGELKLPSQALAQTYLDCVDEVNNIWKKLTDYANEKSAAAAPIEVKE